MAETRADRRHVVAHRPSTLIRDRGDDFRSPMPSNRVDPDPPRGAADAAHHAEPVDGHRRPRSRRVLLLDLPELEDQLRESLPEAGPGKAGTVLTVEFELDGQPFTIINGGPAFTFNEAVSFLITCADQDEVDSY